MTAAPLARLAAVALSCAALTGCGAYQSGGYFGRQIERFTPDFGRTSTATAETRRPPTTGYYSEQGR